MRTMHCATLIVGFILGGAAAAQAQTPDNPPAGQTPAAAPAPAPAAAPAAAPDSPLRQWGTEFDFLFDGYVDANLNDPASGVNALRGFDVRSDTAHVGMGMVTIDHAPAPVGFHLDVGFGQDFDIIHAGNR
ncbi:MAG: outer membrane beta-barrel protein, partial [Bryobacteraceae bacterium]